MSKILVTSASGFVGKALIQVLQSAGYKVRCAVSKKVDSINAEQIVIGRIEECDDWSAALQGINIVIHLAARVHIMNDKVESPFAEYHKVNSLATKTLAEQAAKHNVKRFIFLSSIKVNGECTSAGSFFTEGSVPKPDGPYGLSKLYAENYLKKISENSTMDIVILRPPLIYGPGVKANFLKMLTLVEKKLPLLFGKIQNKRSLNLYRQFNFGNLYCN